MKILSERKIKDREIVYWTVDDGAEELSCVDIEDAIDEHLQQWDLNQEDMDSVITVYGYSRSVVWLGDGVALEPLLELIDDEYHREKTEPTQAMMDAERVFLNAVIAEYKPWNCDRAVVLIVDISEEIEALKEDNS